MILKSQNGDYLGETHILYVDQEADKVQQQQEITKEQVEKEYAQRLVRTPGLLINLLKESFSCLGGNSESRSSDTKGIGK